jgi:exo-1,4-beta-D-glucosaminidase
MREDIFSSITRFSIAVAGLVLGVACAQPEGPVTTSRTLTHGWSLQSAAEVADGGEVVSSAGFDASGWFTTAVPSTPMAALVANGLYPDLYLGTNLEDVDTGLFEGPWWYRTKFEASEADAEKVARLQFAGINYSAEIWLNGQRLATREEIVGAFQVHEIDVSGKLQAGSNALAVEVFPPQPGDFTIGFVDWNPRPPDENMGLWRPVTLRLTGNVSINDVFIETDVDLDTLETAEIRVSAILRNHSDLEVKTAVSGRIDGLSFAADVVLAPQESQLLQFTPDDYDVLRFDA